MTKKQEHKLPKLTGNIKDLTIKDDHSEQDLIEIEKITGESFSAEVRLFAIDETHPIAVKTSRRNKRRSALEIIIVIISIISWCITIGYIISS